jgi:hypothetical protein
MPKKPTGREHDMIFRNFWRYSEIYQRDLATVLFPTVRMFNVSERCALRNVIVILVA